MVPPQAPGIFGCQRTSGKGNRRAIFVVKRNIHSSPHVGNRHTRISSVEASQERLMGTQSTDPGKLPPDELPGDPSQREGSQPPSER